MVFFPLYPRVVFLINLLALVDGAKGQTSNSTSAAPVVTVKNGTYQGAYLPDWDQDAFLGIPYAQPPVGDLRFRWPRPLNESFPETRSAQEYGKNCYQISNQYSTDFNLSEDCLNLNVVRPSGTTGNASLPVLVWIYGGGLSVGSTADRRYNLSGIVSVSQSIQQPIIAVSMNYRLSLWGFLQSPQILAEGSSNAGLLDQRLALRWISENIASFGGDPTRVTIWGESAGAQSIAYHLFSYNGRDDKLYRAAIMESGGPIGAQVQPLAYYNSPFENLTRTVGCYTAKDQLSCLRSLPATSLQAKVSQVWNPLIDGDFLTGYPSQLQSESTSAANRLFNPMALLLGSNSDEGSSFGVKGLDNETAIFNNLLSYRSYALTPPTIRKLLELYPAYDVGNQPPFHVTDNTTFPAFGLQWRRHAAIAGDLVMIAQRRKMAELYAGAIGSGQRVYSYRFDTPLWNASITDGARHYDNVVFSFQNISGALGPVPQFQSYRDLSWGIGVAYVRFANHMDPNAGVANGTHGGTSVGASGGMRARANGAVSSGVSGNGTEALPYWPAYDVADPKNMVLNANGSWVETDDYRKAGMAFINSAYVARELLG